MSFTAKTFAALVAAGSIALFLVAEWTNPAGSSVIFDHFPATIGLPLAAAASLVVVTFFRTAEGPIKFEAFGMKFEGASGPIIMWAICFVAIASFIKALW